MLQVVCRFARPLVPAAVSPCFHALSGIAHEPTPDDRRHEAAADDHGRDS